MVKETEMYDKHKSPEKDDAAGHMKSELPSLQKDEKVEKSGDKMGEHLNAKLEDGEFGKHGMKSHLGHAMGHLSKEGHSHHEEHKKREHKHKY